ncbi:MAG TPA: hypothetical protein VFD36_28250 [Kofleriaceae bacterium]|nr:hypothetical protein [Kofleriaceae bacterium]
MTNQRRCGVLAAMSLVACDGAPQTQREVEPPPPVVVRTDPAGSKDCPYGGSVVSSGFDRSGNGLLDDAEVVTRTVVCNPAPVDPPPPIVVRLVIELPGEHCAAGGTAVQSGPDRDHNGKLDDGEVSHIDYVCGQLLLTRLAAEPAGPNCIAGGVAFMAGRDRDGDGTLADAEVEVTEFECGDVLSRDVAIRSDGDVAALANIRVITGTVSAVSVQAVTAIALPALEHIGGALRIQFNRSLGRLALPQLEQVDGDLVLEFNALPALDCPRLRRVGRFSFTGNTVADLGGLPALREIDGNLQIADTPLVAADLALSRIGGDVEIRRNNALASIAWSLSDRMHNVAITDNPQLAAIDLSVTSRDGQTAKMGFVELFSNPTLGRIRLSADDVFALQIDENPRIANISLDVARVESIVTLFEITTPFDLALSSPRAAGAIEFGGGLIISSPLATLSSAAPLIVDGLCVFDKTRLQVFDPHSSLLVRGDGGGVRFSDNPLLTEVSPITLDGSLQLINNALLHSASFVSLVDPEETGGMVITNNPELVSVPALASVTRVRDLVDVENNPRLVGLFGPPLRRIEGPVFLVNNDSLTSLSYPNLEHVVSDLIVSGNALLETIEMPALTEAADELFIDTNPRLHHIALDALTHADVFLVNDNPRLPACEVLAVFAHVTGFAHGQSGNDDHASCLR